MSGGSMDYLYAKVAGAHFRTDTPERRAFRKHLDRVAAALRAIEWNDSGDGDDGEAEKIRACLQAGAVLEACIDRAHDAAKEMSAELERACNGRYK